MCWVFDPNHPLLQCLSLFVPTVLPTPSHNCWIRRIPFPIFSAFLQFYLEASLDHKHNKWLCDLIFPNLCVIFLLSCLLVQWCSPNWLCLFVVVATHHSICSSLPVFDVLPIQHLYQHFLILSSSFVVFQCPWCFDFAKHCFCSVDCVLFLELFRCLTLSLPILLFPMLCLLWFF